MPDKPQARSVRSDLATTDNRLRIGKIVGCHGLRGEVKVRLASGKVEWPDDLREVLLERPAPKPDSSKPQAKPVSHEPQWLTIESVRSQPQGILLRFSAYPDRTAVEPLIGSTLYADVSRLPSPGENEYWVDDLIGLTVVDAHTRRQYGVVQDLLSSTGSDFLEIRLDDVAETVVVPFLNHFFPTVDLSAGTLSIDLPAGFLPDSDKEPG
jgi:16S rRNA processing protein RimM